MHQTLKSMVWYNCVPMSSRLKIGPPFAYYAVNVAKGGLMIIMIKIIDYHQKPSQPDGLRLRLIQKRAFGKHWLLGPLQIGLR